jgi:hypothetical protein
MTVMKVFNWLAKIWPELFLFLLVSVLFLANYQANTFLTGWDNLHPEFAPAINLERAWQTAWQEYQGLGLLAGMAHGAEFLRQLLLWPLAFFLPIEWYRYAFIFLTLLFGVWGAYFAFGFWGERLQARKSGQLAALLGATFYLLNFGTLQNFYVPYEAFAVFYAVFPWLFWQLAVYLTEGKARNAFFFFLFSILATPAFYVQTIFVVYGVILFAILFAFFLKKKARRWRKILLVLLITGVSNAFWLLPNAYFALTQSVTTIWSKNNLMATDEVAARNAAYGNFSSIIRLQGYWFDYQDFDQSGNTLYLLDPWKTSLQYSWVQILSYLPGVLLLITVFWWWWQKKKNPFLRLSFSFALLLIYFVLAGDNPPFSWFYTTLQNHLPLFSQVFRSAFTKWVVPATFFFALGIDTFFVFLFQLVEKSRKKWQRVLGKMLFSGIFVGLLLGVMWPAFTGNFFYSRLRVKIPQAYFQTFAFFKNMDQNVRIANLPQHSFYGWQWNSWGYRGSGFLWYGIKQPILDRAFDVWSTADENYYWQLQTALDAQDMAAFERVLEKYDVRYLLLDESVVNRNTSKPFDFAAWEEFLASSERIQPVATFDFLKIYQFTEPEQAQTQAFVSLWPALPKVAQQANLTWQDQAYQDLADYQEVNLDQAEQFYPFASLFSNHSQAELPFQLSETDEYFVLTSFLANQEILAADWQPEASELLATEKFFPVRLQWQTVGEQSFFTLEAISPILRFADRQLTWQWQKSLELSSQSCLATKDCVLELNGQTLADFSAVGEQTVLLRSQQQNSLALKQKAQSNYYDYLFIDMSNQHFRQLEQQLPEAVSGITLLLPKESFGNLGQNLLETPLNQNTAKNCRQTAGSFYKETTAEGNLYTASNANSCDSFYLAELAHNQGWLLRTESQHLSGLPMTFAVQVDSLGRSPLETYLPKTASLETSYFFLPPVENFGQGYSFYVASDAYGRLATQNRLASFAVYYWPYRFTQALRFSRAEVSPAQTLTCQFKTEKKALWWYQVDLADCRGQAKLLKLSQAYDSGWLAVSKVDGQWSYLSHEKFSAWSNAWQLTGAEETVYLFFWPQLLEYLGFIFLIIGVPAMFFFSAKRHGSFQKAER